MHLEVVRPFFQDAYKYYKTTVVLSLDLKSLDSNEFKSVVISWICPVLIVIRLWLQSEKCNTVQQAKWAEEFWNAVCRGKKRVTKKHLYRPIYDIACVKRSLRVVSNVD